MSWNLARFSSAMEEKDLKANQGELKKGKKNQKDVPIQ